MLFNSIHFLFFFPVVTTIYFLLPQGKRWAWLLAASCYFYAVFIPKYLLILALLIGIDYSAGLLIQTRPAKKKAYLVASLCANIALLFLFKYFNFFNSSLQAFASLIGWNYPIGALSLLLPIGLSFHTFQSMSYVIEVYRGRQKAEKNLGIYALYVMFYPQLVAGPIERPQNLLHQFYQKHNFDYARVTAGLKLMLWGLFKKIVIADRLAIVVNHVYASPADRGPAALILATVFFAFQIYCDFSGYSDIAIGSAKVMGFNLMKNFDRPYSSRSTSEFWRRWHISLSTWFKDYVYIPLGGNRTNAPRWYGSLFFTFLISGLWHGANWTYILWGSLNGFYLLFAIWTKNFREKLAKLSGLSHAPKLRSALQTVITFSLICFSWIFFRANSAQDSFYIASNLFKGIAHTINGDYLKQALSPAETGVSAAQLALCVLGIVFLEIAQKIIAKDGFLERFGCQSVFVRWTVYYCLILGIILCGVFKNEHFIYFQF